MDNQPKTFEEFLEHTKEPVMISSRANEISQMIRESSADVGVAKGSVLEPRDDKKLIERYYASRQDDKIVFSLGALMTFFGFSYPDWLDWRFLGVVEISVFANWLAGNDREEVVMNATRANKGMLVQHLVDEAMTHSVHVCPCKFMTFNDKFKGIVAAAEPKEAEYFMIRPNKEIEEYGYACMILSFDEFLAFMHECSTKNTWEDYADKDVLPE